MSEIKNTYVIRPIVLDDADALLDLIRLSSGGLSSLQPRLDFLKNYIEHSQHSFSVGCAAVKTQIGKDTPFINFDLKGDGADEYLIASSRYTGATEVGRVARSMITYLNINLISRFSKPIGNIMTAIQTH